VVRRIHVVAIAAAALAAGAAGYGGPGGADHARAQAGGTQADGQAQDDRRAQARADHALRVFRRSVVKDAFDVRPRTLDRLQRQVTALGRAIDAMEDGRPSGRVRWGPSAIDDLREAQEHMAVHMDAARDDDPIVMQTSVWRFLWVLNGLPGPLIR